MEAGRRKQKLFELLLIAVVLGSIGFVAIPPFTQASTEDNIIHIVGVLHHIRSQIDLYEAQHNGALPPTDTPDAFEKAMTQKDAAGFGPYMESMPVNPFNQLKTVRISSDAGHAAGTHGWCFNPATGDFCADDSQCHAQL
jgi:general secretion pathway protein G